MKKWWIAAFFLAALVPGFAEEDRNRIGSGGNQRVALSLGAASVIRNGSDPEETWRLVLVPHLTGEYTPLPGLSFYTVLPARFEIPLPTANTGENSVGGFGDVRVGVGYTWFLRSVTCRLSAMLILPTGVGSKYDIRSAGFTSGSGEYGFNVATGAAVVLDPVALRAQIEAGFGLPTKEQRGGWRKIQSAVSMMILLNRRYSVTYGLSVFYDGGADPALRNIIPVPIFTASMGLGLTVDNFNLSVGVSASFSREDPSLTLIADLGMAWEGL